MYNLHTKKKFEKKAEGELTPLGPMWLYPC